jgi:hypothetical protein
MKTGNNPMIVYFVLRNEEIVYIGQTERSLEKRKIDSLSQAKNGRGHAFGAAIRKHGLAAFKWVVHSIYFNHEDLYAAEKHFIAKYKPRYNVSPGGKHGIGYGWNKGRKESRQSVLDKMSASAINRKRTPRPNDTQVAKDARSEGRRIKYRKTNRPFICKQNGKTYILVVDAAKDLGILANGIYACLNPKHPMKTYKGFSFSYL